MTWNPSGSEAGAVRQDATDALRRAIAEARSFERAMTRVGQIAPARPPGPPTTSIIS